MTSSSFPPLGECVVRSRFLRLSIIPVNLKLFFDLSLSRLSLVTCFYSLISRLQPWAADQPAGKSFSDPVWAKGRASVSEENGSGSCSAPCARCWPAPGLRNKNKNNIMCYKTRRFCRPTLWSPFKCVHNERRKAVRSRGTLARCDNSTS